MSALQLPSSTRPAKAAPSAPGPLVTAATRKRPAAAYRREETIRLCVEYLQLIASYDAGFAADPTDDGDFACEGGHCDRSNEVLAKLNDLSAVNKQKTPLSLDELKAKSAVLQGVCNFHRHNQINCTVRDFIERFAEEVAAALKGLRSDEAAR